MDRELPDEERKDPRHSARHPEVRGVHELRTRSAASPSSSSSISFSTRRCRSATPSRRRSVEATLREASPGRDHPARRWLGRSRTASAAPEQWAGNVLRRRDQSEAIGFLEAHLAPQKRIDTHGAVVILAGERAYKLKRAVKFPYMDFSTVERRAAMCAAEIAINRRLARRFISVRRRCGEAATANWRWARSRGGRSRRRLAGRHAALRRGGTARSHG